MDRAHIRNGQIIKQFNGEKGWILLENGDRASPPVVGYVNGNDKVLPVVEEVQDTSTTDKKFRTDTGYQVEADRVYRLVTLRDMTQQEIDDELAAYHEKEAQQFDNRAALKALATASWHIAKGTVPAGALATPAAYRTWLKSLM